MNSKSYTVMGFSYLTRRGTAIPVASYKGYLNDPDDFLGFCIAIEI